MEDVGRVVGWLLRKVGKALGVLDERTGAFKAHAGVDVLGGQVAEAAVGLCIVLNEDEVPDLDAEIGVHVDELACAVAVGG